MAEPVYTFKEAVPKPTDPLKKEAVNTAPKQDFGNVFNPMQTSQAPAPKQDFGDVFGTKDTNIFGDASKAIQGQLNPTPGPTVGDTLARNNFVKSVDEATRQVKEQSALTGRVDTQQAGGDLARFFTQSVTPQRADFEAQLADQTSRRNSEQVQQGVNNALNLYNTQANLSIADRQLAQDAQQFRSKQEFDAWALQQNMDEAQRDRIWQEGQNQLELNLREKISFAGLNLQEKQLAQEASNFADDLAFRDFALRSGYDENAIARAWQAAQNDKERVARADESGLNRELQRYIADRGFEMDEVQLAETIRQFDSRQEFERWATEAGFDQQEMDRIHESRLQDIQQKWATGERLGAQEHGLMIEKLGIDAANARQERDAILQLDMLGRSQSHDVVMAGIQNQYQTAILEKGFSHDMALAEVQNTYAQELQKLGYDQETALQAARLEAAAINQSRQLEFQKQISVAQMAQESDFFKQQLNLDQQKLDLNREQITQEMEIALKNLSLGERDMDLRSQLLQSDLAQRELETASILLEMAGDNPDMMDMAAEKFFRTVGPSLGLTEEEIQTGIAGMTAASSQTETTTSTGILNNFEDVLGSQEIPEELKGTPGETMLTGAQEAERQKAITAAQENIKNLTPIAVQDLLSNPTELQKYQDLGVIEKRALTLNVDNLLRSGDWEAQGFEGGDLVLANVGGETKLIQLSDDPWQTRRWTTWGNTRRNSWVTGTDLTTGEKWEWQTGSQDVD